MTAGPEVTSYSLARRIREVVSRYGSTTEMALVEACFPALVAFLDHPDCHPYRSPYRLEVGLENRAVLKFGVLATRHGSPWDLIESLAAQLPDLRPLAMEVLRMRLHCHVGIKCAADEGVTWELYPYETKKNELASFLGINASEEHAGLPTPPLYYGLSSTGVLSAYGRTVGATATEVNAVAGFSLPTSNLKARTIFHSRRNSKGIWLPAKGGVELLPFPSHLLNAVLAQFSLNYSYLLHRGGTRHYGVIGRQGSRKMLYTTLLPLT